MGVAKGVGRGHWDLRLKLNEMQSSHLYLAIQVSKSYMVNLLVKSAFFIILCVKWLWAWSGVKAWSQKFETMFKRNAFSAFIFEYHGFGTLTHCHNAENPNFMDFTCIRIGKKMGVACVNTSRYRRAEKFFTVLSDP